MSRLIAFGLILVAGCVQAGCSTARPAAQADAQPAAETWYESGIREFEAEDRADPPGDGFVLFIGSSSIRMWTTLAEDMSPAEVRNRGFGGSQTKDVLAVMDRIVFTHEPGAIVYYCGDNDLGEMNTDSRSAADGFIEFAERVHRRWSGVPIYYMSIKPSVARWKNWDAMARANGMVAEYARTHEGVEYMDLGACLLGTDGTPDPGLFLGDGLHLNALGYERWTRSVRSHLFGGP